ncbi:FRG domain-containing protein [Phycicoccus jejuensis]|uniref:FRG domain-containing protein n=1 Tax=Phycicoccus jejuensis TaxID=367299 RepID=UPI003850C52A
MSGPKSLSDAELQKLTEVGRGVELNTTSGPDFLAVDALHELLQVVGYLKYLRGSGAVMLRGQTSLYSTLDPSLYRGLKVNRTNRDSIIGGFIQTTSPWSCTHADHAPVLCTEKVPQLPSSRRGLLASGTPRYAAEGLLQHYGIRTRWLDFVDNVWVALWFACHDFVRAGRFVHVVRRVPVTGSEYAYLVGVVVDGPLVEKAPGLFRSEGEAHLLDLRRAVPSFYLRPHAQHGWLLRPWMNDPRNFTTINIRVDLGVALNWLGSGQLLSAFGMYPPASVDVGYRTLLQNVDTMNIPEVLGSIDVAGPGY